MASNSTTSNLAKQIDIAYPYAGRDNNSQGFRTNFTNIQNAFLSADSEIQNLKNNLILTNSTSSNLANNKLIQAVFQNCAEQVYSSSDKQGNIDIDYSQGNYQDFQLNGNTVFTVSGMPTSGFASAVIACTPDTGYTPTVTFMDTIVRVGVGTNFPEIITGTTFYEIWANSAGTIYVSKLGNDNNTVARATATEFIAYNSIKIGTNLITTGSNSITTIAAGGLYGTVALLPNQIIASVKSTSTSSNDSSTLRLTANYGVQPGATAMFPTTTTVFTVARVEGVDLIVTPNADPSRDFPVGYTSTVDVTFTNPKFNTPTLATFANSQPPANLKGSLNDLKGALYANATTLYASYNVYDGSSQTWFKVSADTVPRLMATGTTAVTVATTDSSKVLANTEFVQNVVNVAVAGGISGALPSGVILLWYGAVADIPNGWQLCDGTFGTPDLRNKFVIGAYSDDSGVAKANIEGALTKSGGYKDTLLPTHTHAAGSVVTDPGHNHTGGTYKYLLKPPYGGSLTGNDNTGSGTEQAVGGGDGGEMETKATGITVSTTVLDAGSSDGINTNLPPYYALCYIMKTV